MSASSDAEMAGESPSICLCMIVRDEVDVLGRCLDSCRGLIDSWVICDTGSTDGTQELIRDRLADIPGELHERPWVDFGHNRSELMALARGKAGYLLLLDADTTIEADPQSLHDLRADAYLLRHADQARYHTKRLVNGTLAWRYIGVVHEYIHSDEERSVERLEDVAIRSWSAGGARKGRWRRDAELLEAELRRQPENARTVYYLAQTYRDLGAEQQGEAGAKQRGEAGEAGFLQHLTRARDLYEQRAKMGGWDEEVCCAWREAGRLHARLGDWPQAAAAFISAWEERPQRLEAVHDLASGLLDRRCFRSAHRFTSLAAGARPLSVPEDILFVEPWVYEWGLLFQHSIAAYWCGEFDESIRACKRLLKIDSLPEAHRSQTVTNMQHAVRERARLLAERAAAAPPRSLPHVGTPTRGRTR